MTMPGLPKSPAAERIDVDETGKISGVFFEPELFACVFNNIVVKVS